MDRLPDPPGEAAVLGTFTHRVLELLCREEPAERTVERARQLAREEWSWISSRDDFTALGLDGDAQRAFRWRSWEAIEGLWRLEDPSQVDVRSTEQRVTARLGDVPFQGIVDRVESTSGGLAITDYKSGRAPRPDRRDAALTQVFLYAAAVEADSGERPTRVRLLYLGQEAVEADSTPEALSAATASLSSTWADLGGACSAGEFEVRTGPLCGWCPYVTVCAEGRSEVVARVESGRMRPDAPARRLLQV